MRLTAGAMKHDIQSIGNTWFPLGLIGGKIADQIRDEYKQGKYSGKMSPPTTPATSPMKDRKVGTIHEPLLETSVNQ